MYKNGHFGCIYYPITTQIPLVNKHTITKIKKRNNNEIRIQSAIKRNPYYYLFFYTFSSHEPISIGIMDTKYIESTQPIETSKFILLGYKEILFDSFESYTTNKSNKILCDLYIHLLKGLKLLQNSNIIHFGINSTNIIVSNGTPLITEHSNSCFSNDDLKCRIMGFKNVPFECKVIEYLLEIGLSSISLSNIYELTKYTEKKGIQNNDLLVGMNSKIDFLRKFINKPTKDIVEQLLTFSSTWDNYSLSILFLGLLSPREINPFITKWTAILQTNISPDPTKRNTIETSLEQISELLYNSDIQDLLMVSSV
jgi:hypothetical protein